MARVYARLIAESPRARLIAVCGSDPGRSQDIAMACGAVATPSYDDLLANAGVQAVVFANHPQGHIKAAAAARAGKHVLVEKPLAPTVAEGAAIVDACRGSSVVASSVFQLRFGQDVAYARQAIADGRIGAIRAADAFYLSYRSPEYYQAGNGWRRGPVGGVVMNRLIHQVDLMCQFAGPATSVSAAINRHDPQSTVATDATMQLGFEHGVSGVLRGSDTSRASELVMFGVHGERGSIWMRGGKVLVSDDPLGGLLRPGRMAALKRALGAGGRIVRRPEGTVRDQLDDFLDAIQSARSPRATIEDGLRALRIVAAAHESSDGGHLVRLGA